MVSTPVFQTGYGVSITLIGFKIIWGHSSVGRACALQAQGRGFDSLWFHWMYWVCWLVQRLERHGNMKMWFESTTGKKVCPYYARMMEQIDIAVLEATAWLRESSNLSMGIDKNENFCYNIIKDVAERKLFNLIKK